MTFKSVIADHFWGNVMRYNIVYFNYLYENELAFFPHVSWLSSPDWECDTWLADHIYIINAIFCCEQEICAKLVCILF